MSFTGEGKVIFLNTRTETDKMGRRISFFKKKSEQSYHGEIAIRDNQICYGNNRKLVNNIQNITKLKKKSALAFSFEYKFFVMIGETRFFKNKQYNYIIFDKAETAQQFESAFKLAITVVGL